MLNFQPQQQLPRWQTETGSVNLMENPGLSTSGTRLSFRPETAIPTEWLERRRVSSRFPILTLYFFKMFAFEIPFKGEETFVKFSQVECDIHCTILKRFAVSGMLQFRPILWHVMPSLHQSVFLEKGEQFY